MIKPTSEDIQSGKAKANAKKVVQPKKSDKLPAPPQVPVFSPRPKLEVGEILELEEFDTTQEQSFEEFKMR